MEWLAKLKAALARGEGVRLGEAAVVSRRVHTMDPAVPGAVAILTRADAGQAFYGREVQDEVIHLDLFHQVGEVDHRRVAAAVRRTLAAAGREDLADFFDIQTGTGGGRVTGDLVYGKKPSLLASHRNHIHVAGLLGDADLDLLVPLVAALEAEVMAQGLEIRRIDALTNVTGAGSDGAGLDLSHYADNTDSWLRGRGRQTAPGAGEAGSLRGSRGAAGEGGTGTGAPPALDPAGSGGAGWAGGGGTGGAGLGTPGRASPADALADEERLQAALRLSRRLGSPDELKRALDAARAGGAGLGSGTAQVPYLLRELEEEGLIRRDSRGIRLTEAGQALATYFDRHLREVKLRFRKLIRRVPRQVLAARPLAGDRPSPDVRYGPVRAVAPAPPGAWLGDVAVPETVLAGIRRAYLERAQGVGPAGGAPAVPGGGPPAGRGLLPLRLERRDVHVHLRAADRPLYICLLIDASASMAGRRILAAKHLVRHLLVSTRDRIAVVGFQERDVKVYVPFTRDYALVEEGLARIQPMGLTPLAHGLVASLDLIQASRVRRPLLLLITDGIPTVPKWTIDPLADALEGARRVARSRVPFGCIGLMPSRRYLEELARTAGGTLHVVEELDEDALVAIAHRERMRHRGRR